MPTPVVSSLHIHPVKSCKPMAISRGWIDALGLSGDRRYLVANTEGLFLTARKYPKLTHLQATPTSHGLVLAAQGMPTLVLDERQFPQQFSEATVWKQTMQAQWCGEQAQAWISEFLGEPCQLLFFAEQTQRPIKDFQQQQVSFADGYPLLLIGTASLEWLQQHSPEPVSMAQFRPNIVVHTERPFEEDEWQAIKIGELTYRVHAPCERCKLTTLRPGEMTFSPQQEPLRTLLKYRRAHEGGALFGQNVIAEGTGIIEVGQTVNVLASAPVDLVRPVSE